MINRREFGAVLMGMAAPGIPRNYLAAAQKPRKNVGGDYHNVARGDITSKENLEYNLRHGVKHLTAEFRNRPQGAWDLDELKRMKDNCDKYGVVFEAIRMDSHYINKLRKGPERDREMDTIVGNIQKAAQIGVKIITYHSEVIPYRRNGKTPGRGGTTYDSFKLENDWKSVPMGDAGRVTHEDYWERITYFVEKIIPAAKENDVRMACHPSERHFFGAMILIRGSGRQKCRRCPWHLRHGDAQRVISSRIREHAAARTAVECIAPQRLHWEVSR